MTESKKRKSEDIAGLTNGLRNGKFVDPFHLQASCLFSLTQTAKTKVCMGGRMQRTAQKEKVTPVLCLCHVYGLIVRGGAEERRT